MKHLYMLVLCVLLHGCAGYYRTVNRFMGVGDDFVLEGKRIVGWGRPLFPEIAYFEKIGCVDGCPVYEATFRPRKPRSYRFALEYKYGKRIGGRLLKNIALVRKIHYELLHADMPVEIELYHEGRLYRKWEREVFQWPSVENAGPELVKVQHHVGGGVYVPGLPWRASDELTVRIKAKGAGVRDLLKRDGSRMFVYEYDCAY